MFGLERGLVDNLDFTSSLGRVKTDVFSDFLLAPQYSVVYEYAPSELIKHVKKILNTGEYAPELPIRVDVPKRSGLTRPGAILPPIDRLIYQTLIDNISRHAESQLDRSRVFSHVVLDDDPECKMFKPVDECWQQMQSVLQEKCGDSNYCYAVKADVTCFFERIYQHNLINLLRSSGCDARALNLLENILKAFTENDSHGIIQGLFSSDFLGNFYLSSLDSYLAVKGVPSVRYVDDVYLFYSSLNEAKKGLVDLCRILRDEGLNLNESKTKIIKTDELIDEETEIDRLFNNAKDEIREYGTEMLLETYYGFKSIWVRYEEEASEENIELNAMEALYGKVSDDEVDADKIEKFCLPYLARTRNQIAVERSLEGIISRPYLSKIYCSYLKSFANDNREISDRLESIIIGNGLPYDWSLIWPIAALIDVDSVNSNTITNVLRMVEDTNRLEGLRGLATYLVAKHGNSGQRRALRHLYSNEPSAYVRSAILFSAKYLPTNERNSCFSAWGSHSITNSLIAQAIRSGIH